MSDRRLPYKTTKVSVAVTQHRDITGLFAKYDIEAWQFSTHKGRKVAQVRFQLARRGQWARVTLKTPTIDEMTEVQQDQAQKATWRALFFWLKTQFEVTYDYGLFEEEEAFLSWIEIDGAGSPTVAERLLPVLDDMPRLLGPGANET